MTRDELIAFEAAVAAAFEAKQIRAPIHLSGGNEDQLIEIFRSVKMGDWVFSTYRSHYHALLHGIDRAWLMKEILAGRSMSIIDPAHHFFSSAIVGSQASIAAGVAMGLKRIGATDHVWCFLGDMASRGGAFHEARQYAEGNNLPITFVIEDNGLSCDTPTVCAWGDRAGNDKVQRYQYNREHPHMGVGKWIDF
jgi:pyruvate dehydrogenase E1 component alpha subunit